MAKVWIALMKWFATQKIAVQIALLIAGLVASTAALTCLLIENYKQQRIEDKQTIKDKDLQIAVMRINSDADKRRVDSIHRLDMSNMQITVKALFDKSEAEKAQIMQIILNEKSKLKYYRND